MLICQVTGCKATTKVTTKDALSLLVCQVHTYKVTAKASAASSRVAAHLQGFDRAHAAQLQAVHLCLARRRVPPHKQAQLQAALSLPPDSVRLRARVPRSGLLHATWTAA